MEKHAACMSCGLARQRVNRSRNVLFLGHALALSLFFTLGAWRVQAQTVKINLRPLTAQEITNNVLPSTTQTSPGTPNVGIGQPAYLELMITKGTVVTQVTWSLPGRPTGSAAVINTNSPLANVPTYDVGDRNAFDVVGRAVLVPDVVGSTLKGDYTVVAKVMLTNKTLTVTNMVYGSKYQGMYSEEGFGCEMCHYKLPTDNPKMTAVEDFALTQHATAFKRKINGEAGAGFKSTCVSCHVLGYDATAGATNGGFDDVALQVAWAFPSNLATPAATNNWDAMPPALQAKGMIQCESCHGPGYRHMTGGGKTAMIGISLSAGNCGQCHDKMSHHVKNYEWGQTLHASGYVFRSGSCAPCHSTKGFVEANDPSIRLTDGVSTNLTRGTYNEGVTCAACHDPHTTGMGESQLREATSVTLENGTVVTRGGAGLLCMKCHHDRNEANNRALGTSGPHHGVQGDLLFGENAIEYGMSMPSSRHWDVVKDTCVTCHMQETPAGMTAEAKNHVGGHTFTIGWANASNTVHLTEACVSCHGEIESFNFGGEDYDQDGSVEGVQKEISDMLDTLSSVYTNINIFSTNITTSTGLTTSSKPPISTATMASLRQARYNWLLVTEDGSLGVHNPKYIAAILRASIDDLKGGIDVDHDGLPDAWEIAMFGNLTSQSGSSDYDGDGLTNAQEKALGTNPKLKDTDNDGVWDGAELQAGTDPLSAGSRPGTNQVSFLPAFELGYFPGELGVTRQFQAIDSLEVPGGWTNIGSSFVTSNAWFYHLISPRDAKRKFFRVTTP